MPKLFKRLSIACLFLLIAHTALAQADLIEAMNQQLISLKTLSPDADFSDLEKLKVILKDKPIIGIGEATHGTHEFFLFKHRMLQFLVKEMGVKTFVIEDDFASAQIMNDYLVNGKGDFNGGMQGLTFGIWFTQEFADMVKWLKTYNDAQTPGNKVRFFGCDMQFGVPAMQLLKNELTKTNRFGPEMAEGMEALKKYAPALTGAEKTAIKNIVNSLAAIKFTEGDTALYYHAVREEQQVMAYNNAQSKLFPAKQSDVRDKYMAENVEWIYNYTNHNKMMIWAHNGHINKTAGSDGYVRMGSWLDKIFKDKYYAMGFDFNGGNMRSYDMKQRKNVAVELPRAKAGSSGDVFAQCNATNFILDFKTASANPLINTFLNTNVPSAFYGVEYTIGTTPHYVTHKLAQTYDAVIFIKDTNAAMGVKSEKETK
jgi:erythromycin esterase